MINRDPGRRAALALVVFLLLSFGLSWLIAFPLWLGDGLETRGFPVYAVAMMATPAIAALVVVLAIERPEHPGVELGLKPVPPVKRLITYGVLALLVPIGLVLSALVVGALLGRYPSDFRELSGFQALLDAQLAAVGSPPLEVPLHVLAAAQLINVVVGALINTIPALGEELGWRGWLLPHLLKRGVVPALVLSGIIWGLWHAPLILLGYNYPTAPGWLGLLMMVGMCVLVGAVFGWFRIRSASVWPAALAHGSFNAAAGLQVVFARDGATIDTVQGTILGWSGWFVPLIVVVILVAAGRFRPKESQPEQENRD